MPRSPLAIRSTMTADEKRAVEAINRVDDWRGLAVSYKQIAAGFTNPTWEVTAAHTRYFLKIPGQGTERFINRDAVHQANEVAGVCGCGPKTMYWFPDTKVEILEWLEGYRMCTWADARNATLFYKIIDTMKSFHQSKTDLITQSSAFDQAWNMIDLAKKDKAILPYDLERAEWLLHRLEEAFFCDGTEYHPCHNDTCILNFMWNEDMQDVKMIDFEYASMGDISNDLAIFSNDLFYEEAHDVEMVRYYYGDWNERMFARMKLMKLVADIYWAMWASVQSLRSTLDFDYVRNHGWKFARLRSHWVDCRIDYWVNLLLKKPLF